MLAVVASVGCVMLLYVGWQIGRLADAIKDKEEGK